MRNLAGIIQQFPTGNNEVEYSNVMKIESRRGCGSGRGRSGRGICQHLPGGGVKDKEELYSAKKQFIMDQGRVLYSHF